MRPGQVTHHNADDASGKDHGEFLADDGSGEIRVDDGCGITVDPVKGHRFASVIGILHYSFGNFKIWPRSDSDFKSVSTAQGGRPEAPKKVAITGIQAGSDTKSPEHGVLVAVKRAVVTAKRGGGFSKRDHCEER